MFRQISPSSECIKKLERLDRVIEQLKKKNLSEQMKIQLQGFELEFLNLLELTQHLEKPEEAIKKFEGAMRAFIKKLPVREVRAEEEKEEVDERQEQPDEKDQLTQEENERALMFSELFRNIIGNENHWEILGCNPMLYDRFPKGILAMQKKYREYENKTPSWASDPTLCKLFLKDIKKIAEERLNDKYRIYNFSLFDNNCWSKDTTKFYKFLKKLDVDKLRNEDYITALQLPGIAKEKPQPQNPRPQMRQ